MAEDHEIDRLDPQSRRIKLSTGLEVELLRLRTRQFFRLLRILTHGAGPAILKTSLDFDAEDPEQFAQRLIMVVISAVPDAEQESIDFLSSMVRPVSITDKPDSQLSKQEKEDNAAAYSELAQAMWNPDPEDTVTIISEVIHQEAPDLMALGKRVAGMLAVARKTGQDKKESPEPVPGAEELARRQTMVVDPVSQARSQRSSTSSARSTDGATSTSSGAPSRASGSAQRPSRAAASANTDSGSG